MVRGPSEEGGGVTTDTVAATVSIIFSVGFMVLAVSFEKQDKFVPFLICFLLSIIVGSAWSFCSYGGKP